ncbi:MULTISPECIES: acyl carrier protein [unclassified Micromonospora]|uniref:acyl carrier protein n=1 Tax=Micromonospora TaxID=1873 RepID=UPI002415A43C|nr:MULTISPECIES: acyl carrier protein [unclassified Micromonospora]MDG4820134.1 acyl carrier protein [Micromonospora sp. WMMD956]WFE56546.1 acyl carrier protein [Micromonospora sp. WMMD712]
MPDQPSTTDVDRAAVATAVKRVVIAESRLAYRPEDIADDEPLNGKLLRVNSLGFLGMLVRLEDDLDLVLPDDIFVGRSFTLVSDLIDVVVEAAGADR